MIVTDDDDLAARARHLTTQAKVPDVGYLHDEVGYNYRLTNIAAALGLAQLERLDEFVGAKRAIAARYDEAFGDTGLVAAAAGRRPRRHVLAVLGPRPRRRPARSRRAARPPHRARRRRPGPLAAAARPAAATPSAPVIGGEDVAGDLFRRGVSLPCSTDLTEADQERVVEAVRSFFA